MRERAATPRVVTMMWKEFRQIRREPRLVVLIVLAPVLFLFLFGVALRLQFENVPLVLLDEDGTFLSMSVRDKLWAEEYFVVEEVDDPAELRRRLDAGTARIAVRIPPDFSERLFAGRSGHVEVMTDGTMPSVAVAMEANASSALGSEFGSTLWFDDPDAAFCEVPPDAVVLDVRTLYNEELRDAAFFLPGVIGILVLQVALVLAAAGVVREKEARTLEQLLVVPLTRAELLAGKLLPYALIAFVDFLLILGVGMTVFDLGMAGSPALLFALTVLYILSVLSLGLFISTVAETQQQAIFAAVAVLIPSILLSGFVFPIEAMPGWVQPIAHVLPLTHYLVIIRGIMLKGVGMGLLAGATTGLVVIAVLAVGIAGLRLRRSLPA